MAKIEAEIDKHTKVVGVEEKVISAVKEKKTINENEYMEHIENCQKLKGKAPQKVRPEYYGIVIFSERVQDLYKTNKRVSYEVSQ